MYGPVAAVCQLGATEDFGKAGYVSRAQHDAAELLLFNTNGSTTKEDPRFQELLTKYSVSQSLVSVTEALYVDMEPALRERQRPWLLNPCNFHRATKELGLNFDACRSVVGDAMRQFTVTLGMQTELQMPNGSIVRPGDQLKGAVFRIANICFTEENQDQYDELYKKHKDKLYYGNKDEQDERKDIPHGLDGSISVNKSSSDRADSINSKA